MPREPSRIDLFMHEFWKQSFAVFVRAVLKYKRTMLVSGVLCIVVCSAAFYWWGGGSGDYDTYRRAVRRTQLAGALRYERKWLPDSISGPLGRLCSGPFDELDLLSSNLLRTGFLTNLCITVPSNFVNLSPDEIFARLKKSLPNNDFMPAVMEYNWQSNTSVVIVTCPTNDVVFLQGALRHN